MSATITDILARRVWDSRGRPTVEAEIVLSDGRSGRAIAPAGASRGSREALELRDGGEAFVGLGVDRALAAIHDVIRPAFERFSLRCPVAGLPISPPAGHSAELGT